MKWLDKVNPDVWFVMTAFVYFSARKPMAAIIELQTITDVLMIFTLGLVAVKHLVGWMKR